jgi:hypothetical protein
MVMGRLPEHEVIRFPSGRWGFVGRCAAELVYVRTDGTRPSSAELETARAHGPRLAGLQGRTWPTEADARAALAEYQRRRA